MWPLGPDSPESKGRPRNIKIRWIEDALLDMAQDRALLVPVVIDAFSVQHVEGAEIDYVDSLMGSGFAINNPNAVSSCACGSSFNTDGSPAKAGGCH